MLVWFEKRKCITDEKNKKKTQYVLRDYMFKFWYEFIPKATSVIEMGAGRDLLSGYTEWFEALSEEDVLLFTLDSLYE